MDPLERLLLEILDEEAPVIDPDATITDEDAEASLQRFLARPVRWDVDLGRYVFTDD